MEQTEIVVLSKSEYKEILRQNAVAVASELLTRIDTKSVPELMTKTELAEYLKCSVSKINDQMKKGLPTEYFGDVPRFRKSKIDEWLAKK